MRYEKLGEFYLLIAELESRNAAASAEDAGRLLICLAGNFNIGNLFKIEHLGKEFQRAVHILHGQANSRDGLNKRGPGRDGYGCHRIPRVHRSDAEDYQSEEARDKRPPRCSD